MNLTSFFPAEFVVSKVISNYSNVTIEIISSKNSCKCPHCHTESTKIHSKYTRLLSDLSVIDKPLSIYLTSRKFFCRNLSCPRKIFTERFDSLIIPYARRTDRLTERLKKLAFSTSCEAASRISQHILVSLSADTFLRIIKREKIVINSEYKNIGVDDFAFRKGCSYGTIICDLDTHRPIDILPDRSTKTLSNWLKEHTGINLVTRDRANAYSKALSDVCPSAVQIADKWHLLRNMCETLSDILKSKYTKGITLENTTTVEHTPIVNAGVKQTKYEIEREVFQSKKRSILEETKRLYESGVSQKDIMKIMGLSKKTVYRYLRRTEPPYSSVKYRGSALDKHLSTIEKYFEAGAKSKDILNIIRNEGYNGSESSLRMLLSKMNKNKKLQQYDNNTAVSNATATTKMLIKREKIEKLFWTSYTYLKEKDQEVLNEIVSSSQELSMVYQAVQSFRAIFETKEIETLNMWIQNNSISEIQHIKKFAQKLRKDLVAVSNSIKYDYTNGLIEGQVNRLKTIKRMMYGRANFDLLKQRVLYQY